MGLLLGGAIGLYLAWLRVTAASKQADSQRRQAESAARQTDLQQRKLATDLFTQSVEQLSSDKLEIRLVAVYTLKQLVDDDPLYRRPVAELLTAVARANKSTWGDDGPPADIVEIYKIIGRLE